MESPRSLALMALPVLSNKQAHMLNTEMSFRHLRKIPQPATKYSSKASNLISTSNLKLVLQKARSKCSSKWWISIRITLTGRLLVGQWPATRSWRSSGNNSPCAAHSLTSTRRPPQHWATIVIAISSYRLQHRVTTISSLSSTVHH